MISIRITEEGIGSPHGEDTPDHQAPTSTGRNGQMRILVDRKFADWLLELRGPGESYSDAILRLGKG